MKTMAAKVFDIEDFMRLAYGDKQNALERVRKCLKIYTGNDSTICASRRESLIEIEKQLLGEVENE